MINVKPLSKAEILEDYIVKNILPKYTPGTKIPSELVMAKELNTSRTTIHKIFSNLTSKGILYRENGLGTFVSEPQPEDVKVKQITAICSSDEWHDPSRDVSWFNTQYILESFSRKVLGNNYIFNIFYIHPDNQSLEEGIADILETNADAFIFPTLGGYDRYIKKLMELGKPCVVRTLEPYHECHCVYGLLDDSFCDAMSYLIENGRKNIAFLANENRFTDNKLAGVLRSMKNHNINPDSLIKITTDNSFELDGYRGVMRFISNSQDIDAIIAVTDRLAFGAAAIIEYLGLDIPEDIAIIGSDNLPECLTMSPQLASISSDFHQMGEMMFDIIDNVLSNSQTEITCTSIEHRFIPRESCGYNNK